MLRITHYWIIQLIISIVVMKIIILLKYSSIIYAYFMASQIDPFHNVYGWYVLF